MLGLHQVDIFIGKERFLRNINLKLEKGEIIRLIAPNGGGKTTLIESLLGLRKSQGEIQRDFEAEDYGYLPQVAHQFPKIHLFLKDICPLSYEFYPKELLLKDWSTASGGERKKALIAKSITEAKKLLILDEPFNHLDDQSCKQLASTLSRLSNEGLSIIYTSHDIVVPNSRDIEVSQWKS